MQILFRLASDKIERDYNTQTKAEFWHWYFHTLIDCDEYVNTIQEVEGKTKTTVCAPVWYCHKRGALKGDITGLCVLWHCKVFKVDFLVTSPVSKQTLSTERYIDSTCFTKVRNVISHSFTIYTCIPQNQYINYEVSV